MAILDREEVDELQAAFQEVAGRDQIVFAARSARLDSTSRFQLERQALWLTANEHVAIRLRAEAANPRDVAERRLALRRAESVRSYLKEIGVRGDQVVGIDIDYGKSGAVSTLIDEFRSGEPPARQAVNDIRRGKR